MRFAITTMCRTLTVSMTKVTILSRLKLPELCDCNASVTMRSLHYRMHVGARAAQSERRGRDCVKDYYSRPLHHADHYNWCVVPDKGFDAVLFGAMAVVVAAMCQGKFSALWTLIAGIS